MNTLDRVWTIDQIMALRPCHPREQIEEWMPDGSLTLREILLHSDVPPMDRVWVATRPGVLDLDTLTRWINGIADRAVRTHYLECGVPDVERWARAWLDGSDRSYTRADAAARDAAATRDAARAAAYAASAARAAAYAARAACAAAYAARSEAACATADAYAYTAAARAVVAAADAEKQITDLVDMLETNREESK